jgi:elongation factor G
MGDITGDISSMRGWVNGTSALPNNQVKISGQVPLSELTNYQSRLKSITGGEGSYTMEFSRYEPVPPKTQQEIIAAYNRPGEEGD